MTLHEFLKKIINKIPGKRRAIGKRRVAKESGKWYQQIIGRWKTTETITEKRIPQVKMPLKEKHVNLPYWIPDRLKIWMNQTLVMGMKVRDENRETGQIFVRRITRIVGSLRLCLYFCFVNRILYTNFLDFTYMH